MVSRRQHHSKRSTNMGVLSPKAQNRQRLKNLAEELLELETSDDTKAEWEIDRESRLMEREVDTIWASICDAMPKPYQPEGLTLQLCCELWSRGRATTNDPLMANIATLPNAIRQEIISMAFGLGGGGTTPIEPGVYASEDATTLVISPGFLFARHTSFDDSCSWPIWPIHHDGSLRNAMYGFVCAEEYDGYEHTLLHGLSPMLLNTGYYMNGVRSGYGMNQARSNGRTIRWCGYGDVLEYCDGWSDTRELEICNGTAIRSPLGLQHGLSEWAIQLERELWLPDRGIVSSSSTMFYLIRRY